MIKTNTEMLYALFACGFIVGFLLSMIVVTIQWYNHTNAYTLSPKNDSCQLTQSFHSYYLNTQNIPDVSIQCNNGDMIYIEGNNVYSGNYLRILCNES